MQENTAKGLRTIRRSSYVLALIPFLAAVATLYQGPPIWAYMIMAGIFAVAMFLIGTIIAVERLMQRIKSLEQSWQSSARPSAPEG